MKVFADPSGSRIIRTAVDWSGDGTVLADYLAGRFTYRSRTEWCDRIAAGEITVNDRAVSPETVLARHDVVEYRPGDLPEPPADLNFRIVCETPEWLVIDKPGNLCIHPAGPFFRHTLWHPLRVGYGEIHFINRLDRETSGLLLAARTAAAAKLLSRREQLRSKVYQVIVHGEFPERLDAEGFLRPAGSIVRKKRLFSREMPPHPPFERAATRFTCLRRGGGFSLIRAELDTGRMHQIRATLAALGFPVAGDKLYGVDETLYLKQRSGELSAADRKRLIFSRQALHSSELEFCDPVSGTVRRFTSPLPPELADFVNQMERTRTHG